MALACHAMQQHTRLPLSRSSSLPAKVNFILENIIYSWLVIRFSSVFCFPLRVCRFSGSFCLIIARAVYSSVCVSHFFFCIFLLLLCVSLCTRRCCRAAAAASRLSLVVCLSPVTRLGALVHAAAICAPASPVPPLVVTCNLDHRPSVYPARCRVNGCKRWSKRDFASSTSDAVAKYEAQQQQHMVDATTPAQSLAEFHYFYTVRTPLMISFYSTVRIQWARLGSSKTTTAAAVVAVAVVRKKKKKTSVRIHAVSPHNSHSLYKLWMILIVFNGSSSRHRHRRPMYKNIKLLASTIWFQSKSAAWLAWHERK